MSKLKKARERGILLTSERGSTTVLLSVKEMLSPKVKQDALLMTSWS